MCASAMSRRSRPASLESVRLRSPTVHPTRSPGPGQGRSTARAQDVRPGSAHRAAGAACWRYGVARVPPTPARRCERAASRPSRRGGRNQTSRKPGPASRAAEPRVKHGALVASRDRNLQGTAYLSDETRRSTTVGRSRVSRLSGTTATPSMSNHSRVPFTRSASRPPFSLDKERRPSCRAEPRPARISRNPSLVQSRRP